jgi:hypothetical protein
MAARSGSRSSQATVHDDEASFLIPVVVSGPHGNFTCNYGLLAITDCWRPASRIIDCIGGLTEWIHRIRRPSAAEFGKPTRQNTASDDTRRQKYYADGMGS